MMRVNKFEALWNTSVMPVDGFRHDSIAMCGTGVSPCCCRFRWCGPSRRRGAHPELNLVGFMYSVCARHGSFALAGNITPIIFMLGCKTFWSFASKVQGLPCTLANMMGKYPSKLCLCIRLTILDSCFDAYCSAKLFRTCVSSVPNRSHTCWASVLPM